MFSIIGRKLQYRVTLLVWGILLFFGVIGSGIVLYLERGATVSHFEQSTYTLAAVLAETIERDMLLGDREHIQKSVEFLAASSPVLGVAVISNDGRVYASADAATVGSYPDSRQAVPVLASGTGDGFAGRYSGDSLTVSIPVVNKPQCHACHDAGTSLLGRIEIARDTAPLDAQTRQQTIIMAVMAGLTFVSVATMLAFTLRSAVTTPLSKLAMSARRIAEGDLTSRVDIGRQDEVGLVARTFNDMAERVEGHSRALQERTEQLQEMAKMRGQLLEQLTSAQEEERRRLARELHDEVGQAISSIMLDLAMAIDDLPLNAVAARERLAQSRAIAAQTLTELRKLIYDLRPEVLDQLGLIPAIRSYAKSHLEARHIEVSLSFRGIRNRLPPHTETVLFRVIQEALNNVVRHAGATRVSAQVALTDSRVVVQLQDDGIGFDVEAAFGAAGSWGLRGIQERAIAAGGELTVDSKPGEGTRLRFDIPLEDVTNGQAAPANR